MRTFAIAVFAFCLFAGMNGCAPRKVKVQGKLVWADDAAAVELVHGQVIFESAETKISSRGVIQADGTFRINTEGPDDGVIPGTYKVAIVEHRPAGEGSTKIPQQHLQDKYYSFESSGLEAKVVSEKEIILLKLERMPGKK